MLRYDRQTKPGSVAWYDIWQGNGADPFLQPRSPHGAGKTLLFIVIANCTIKQQKFNHSYVSPKQKPVVCDSEVEYFLCTQRLMYDSVSPQ